MIDDYTFRPVRVKLIATYARIPKYFFMYEGLGQMKFSTETEEVSVLLGDVIGIDDKGKVFKIDNFYASYQIVE